MCSVPGVDNSAISYWRYSGHQTIATGPREEGNQETVGEGEEEERHACDQTGTRNAREEVFPPLYTDSFTSGQEQGSHLVSE